MTLPEDLAAQGPVIAGAGPDPEGSPAAQRAEPAACRPPARKPVVSTAHALTVFRALSDTEGRQYTATTFPRDPYQGCERTIRMARAVGYLHDSITDAGGEVYAILDVLDSDGQIVQDFVIPHARAFRWFYRKLTLRVERYGDAEDQ